jgi:hypothetical protein
LSSALSLHSSSSASFSASVQAVPVSSFVMRFMSNEMPRVQFQVNLDVPRDQLQRALQRTIYLVSGALNSSTYIEEAHLKLPDIGIEATFDSSLKWSTDEVRNNLKEWTLQNGFRDTVESLSAFLEEIHRICSVWSLIKKQERGQTLTGKDLQNFNEVEPRKFHRLGLPDKLDHLRDSHFISVDPDMIRNVLSVNRARNCLVHRSGIVTDLDAEAGKLIVRWRRMKLVVTDEDGERELVLGVVNKKGGSVGFRFVDDEKSFNVGDSLGFSPQEFQHIAWSVFLFASGLTSSLSQWGQSNGLVQQPLPSA